MKRRGAANTSQPPQSMINEYFIKNSNFKGFFVAFSYGVISVAITFFNKAVFVYGFNASNALTLGQIIFSIVFLVVMKQMKLLEFEDFSSHYIKALFPLSASFFGMVVTGLAALRYVNVPVYSALRRLTTFIVIAGQYFWLDKTVSRDELQSVIVMVFGAFVAGYGDLTFDAWGYFLTGVNCFVTALYLLMISKKSKETGLSTFGLMFYNNIISIPLVLLVVYWVEWEELMTYDKYSSFEFQLCFFMSSILAFLLNYFVFLCSLVNSPLTTSVTGQLKNIIQTVLGLFLFGGVPLTPAMTIGLSMSTIGGIWYGFVKYQESQGSRPAEKKEQDLSEIKTDGSDEESK